MTPIVETATPGRDERKTAALASWSKQAPLHPTSGGTLEVHTYELARSVLRAPEVEQSGFGADIMRGMKRSLMRLPMLFLEGEQHQEQRRATARFFAPKWAEENYRELIERETSRLIEDLRNRGTCRLDSMAMDMSVAVAAEIVGLTEHLLPGMPERISSFLTNPPVGLPMSPKLVWRMITSQAKLGMFYLLDVRPNIKSRRRTPRQDVISHLIGHGYKDSEILTECVLFGAAGMVTTREFITMAALHLIERPMLRDRFLLAGEDERRAILEEVLRLEPVIGKLYRRATSAFNLPNGEQVAVGQQFEVDVRSSNADEAAVGACPFQLDPDRAMPDSKTARAGMSFGDGRHRCPGAFIAMQESAVFLARLLALPGLRVVGTPSIAWSNLVGGYEFHECTVAVDSGATIAAHDASEP